MANILFRWFLQSLIKFCLAIMLKLSTIKRRELRHSSVNVWFYNLEHVSINFIAPFGSFRNERKWHAYTSWTAMKTDHWNRKIYPTVVKHTLASIYGDTNVSRLSVTYTLTKSASRIYRRIWKSDSGRYTALRSATIPSLSASVRSRTQLLSSLIDRSLSDDPNAATKLHPLITMKLPISRDVKSIVDVL